MPPEDVNAGAPPASDSAQPASQQDIGKQVAEGVRKGLEESQRSEREKREAEEKELREVQRKVYRNAQKKRDEETGRYAGKEPDGKAAAEMKGEEGDKDGKEAKADQAKAKEPEKKPEDGKAKDEKGKDGKEAEDAPQKGETKDAKDKDDKAPKKPVHEAPAHWPKSVKEKFGNIDPELQKEISEAAKKDREINSRLGDTIKKFEPVAKVLEEHAESFRRNGLSYDQGLKVLLAASDALDRDPAGAIRQLMQQYRVSPEQLYQAEFQQPPDPALQHLQSKVAQLEQALAQAQARDREAARAEADAQYQSNVKLIQQFADKPHFSDLEDDIARHIQVLRAESPHRAPAELLQEAYDRALWSNPKTRAAVLEKQRAEEAEKRAEEARKAADAAKAAAVVNVKGSPHAVASDDIREIQRKIYRKHHAA